MRLFGTKIIAALGFVALGLLAMPGHAQETPAAVKAAPAQPDNPSSAAAQAIAAKDRAEFDQFMNDRRGRPPAPTGEASPA